MHVQLGKYTCIHNSVVTVAATSTKTIQAKSLLKGVLQQSVGTVLWVVILRVAKEPRKTKVDRQQLLMAAK